MRQPNILLIIADDMGYGDFGAFSQGRCHTPAIDHLVRTGLCCTQHYSAAPVCAPARAGLLTGRYPHRTGAIDTYEHRGTDRISLRETLLPQLLHAGGYSTGLVGKWHNGAFDPRYEPLARGFDEFLGFLGGWTDYYTGWLNHNQTLRRNDGTYVTDLFTDAACDFISRHRRQPFFLQVAYNAPHFPLQAPEEEIRPYRETGRFTEAVSTIYAMNRRMDRGIEKLLEQLHRLGLEENTLVIFTSDNGPSLGGNHARYNCNFAGAKGNVYEGGIRVPMVMRWPAGITGGGRSIDQMVHFVDWLPTLLSLAGVKARPDLPLDGQDLSALLKGEPQEVDPVRYWQWNRYTPIPTCNAAMRDGPWKLVRPQIPAAMKSTPEDGQLDAAHKQDPASVSLKLGEPDPPRQVPDPPPMQLFNLADDPHEARDLSAEQPARLDRMAAALQAWFEVVDGERRQAVR